MYSHGDIERLHGVFVLQADIASRRVREVTEAKDAAQERAEALRQESEALLPGLRLAVASGVDRATLFERLRGVAVARAHALECRLQVDEINEDLASMSMQEQAHRAERNAHASRARRLEEVGRRQHKRERAHALRVLEIDAEERHAWK